CIVHGSRFYSDSVKRMAELEQGKGWLAEQHQSLMALAEQRQAALIELEARLARADKRRRAWMRAARRPAALLAHVAKQRAQADEQRQACTRIAEEQEVPLAVQQNQALLHAEALAAIVNSRGYRLLHWSRSKLFPLETLRGRFGRFLLRWLFRVLRLENAG